jgi:hypothetical protein
MAAISSRTVRGLCIAAAAVAVALPGCGGGSDRKSGQPLPAPSKTLKPGTYTPRTFQPKVTFDATSGWTPASAERRDYFDLIRKNAIFSAISLERVSQVYSPQNPTETGITRAPADLIPWISSHPHLRSGPSKSAKIFGKSATEIDAIVKSVPKNKKTRPETCEQPCLPLFLPSDGEPVVYNKGDQLRFLTFKVGDQKVLATIAARPSEWKAFLPLAEKLLEDGRVSD